MDFCLREFSDLLNGSGRRFGQKHGRAQICFAGRSFLASRDTERFLPNEMHALRLSFMNSLERSTSTLRGRERSTSKSALRASGTACQNSHAGAEINSLIDVMSHEKDSHTVFAPDIQQKFLHHQARLGIKGAVNIQHSGVFMAHLLRGEICGRFSPALFPVDRAKRCC